MKMCESATPPPPGVAAATWPLGLPAAQVEHIAPFLQSLPRHNLSASVRHEMPVLGNALLGKVGVLNISGSFSN